MRSVQTPIRYLQVRALSPGLKWPGGEADHSAASLTGPALISQHYKGRTLRVKRG